MDAARSFTSTAVRLDRVQGRAVDLSVTHVGDRLVLEALDESLSNDDGSRAIQKIGQSLTLAFDVSDEAATLGVPDERDEHEASCGPVTPAAGAYLSVFGG
jgi:hypothetical protein